MSPRLPRDIPKSDVLSAMTKFGFHIDREAEHIALKRKTASGTELMILPNHRRIKLSTLLHACRRCGISSLDLEKALRP